MNKVERPNPNDWAHKEKTFRQSKGKCLCNSIQQMKECINYEVGPLRLCANLNNLLNCDWKEND